MELRILTIFLSATVYKGVGEITHKREGEDTIFL